MPQKNIQIQHEEQQQTLTQTLTTAQQTLLARLLELPTEALIQRVETECLDNPWLEKKTPELDEDFAIEGGGKEGVEYNPANDYRSEDDIPTYQLPASRGDEHTLDTMEYGDTQSFYDRLKEQIAEFDVTDQQRKLLEYLIGSLEEDGLLRKSVEKLSDELAIYQDIDVTPRELEDVLAILWQFEPPGIGARSLQECLRLQILRLNDHPLRASMLEVVNTYWDDFIHKRWDIIARRMRLTTSQANTLQHELVKLNPRPGAALDEPFGRSTQQVTPDFIIETDDYGKLTISLNNSGVPDLQISVDATSKLKNYAKQNDTTLTLAAREDIAFTRRYVERGQLFINALRQRRETMLRTMAAIVSLQPAFFQEGDETQLQPMVREDVAQIVGLDASTVSRVCNSKYVQTPHGTYPLKWFFSQRAIEKDGDTLSARQVMVALRALIDAEDKKKPLSDDSLTQLMKEKGFNIARRTISKYREQMNIPVARMRKQ
ncbi:MAG: RNA polymerase factor sigma-54 [Bacteroidaceae bacterium]|nr:RNA polymerase factor sigma-54 [Bacteroidaceae bacterium]